jgi:hypothetical protein
VSDIGLPYPGRAADRWGHFSARILIAAIVVSIVLGLRPLPYSNPGALFVPLLLFIVVIASAVLMRQHDRRLCEQCLAAMPLNAAEMATRYHRRFAVTHLAEQPRMVVGYLLMLLGANLALLGTGVLPHRVELTLWAACQSTMIYLIVAHSTHRRLQPWCPQCSGRDGGGEWLTSTDPMPTGSQQG